MTDGNTGEIKRLAGVMPRYFGIWSATGVHVGVWDDGYIAGKVLAEEYPNGKIVEMVSVHDAGEYAVAKLADREAYCDRTQSMVDDIEALRDKVGALEAKLAEEQRISTMRGNMIEFDLAPALADAQAKLAVVEGERDRYKRRGDNHWETLRRIRDAQFCWT